jgi:hypothetical protein
LRPFCSVRPLFATNSIKLGIFGLRKCVKEIDFRGFLGLVVLYCFLSLFFVVCWEFGVGFLVVDFGGNLLMILLFFDDLDWLIVDFGGFSN